ncbi:MAG: hypothetical protein DRH57_03290 [Candidatus Cloacimonadota bacterium]|nr:MAG: hypothetical protein DRH57_03290 [Candidatus Cloacimonadota bacterium]
MTLWLIFAVYRTMLMTKQEYKQFKSKYEFLGQLEKERQNTEFTNKQSIKRFLNFLDEIYTLTLNNKKIPTLSASKLKAKILLRKILNKLSDDAFNEI